MKRPLALFFLFLWLGIPGIGRAADSGEVREFVGAGGHINWTTGRVRVVSTAAEMQSRYKACRASVVVAQRDMVELIGEVRVDSDTLVKNGILSQDIIRSTIQGKLQGGRVTDQRMNADGSCTVELEVNLEGPLTQGVYGQYFAVKQSLLPGANIFATVYVLLIPAVYAADIDPLMEIPAIKKRLDDIETLLRMHPEVIGSARSQGSPTGLVVDVRGSSFMPSMTPRLRNAVGEILYPDAAGKPAGSGRLLSLFLNNLTAAQSHPRIGERPLLVKAVKTWEAAPTEIVLGDPASEKVREMIQAGSLANAPVIIVMD